MYVVCVCMLYVYVCCMCMHAVCMCMYAVCVCMLYVYVCCMCMLYVYAYVYVCVYVNVTVYMYMYMYVYVCVCATCYVSLKLLRSVWLCGELGQQHLRPNVQECESCMEKRADTLLTVKGRNLSLPSDDHIII